MPLGIGNFLGNNAGVIGTGLGTAAGSLVGQPMLGASIGGALGGALQTGTGNPSTDPASLNPAAGTILQQLLAQQQNRSLGNEAASLVNQSGLGLDRGQFEASAAVRGAGRNAFGTLLREGQERGERQRGQAFFDISRGLSRDQFNNLQQLLAAQIGGNQFAIGTANSNQIEGNNRRDSFLNSGLDVLGTLLAQQKFGGGAGGGSGGTNQRPNIQFGGRT